MWFTRGFLGMSVACARCHDHKYDPFDRRLLLAVRCFRLARREPAELPLLGDTTIARVRSVPERQAEKQKSRQVLEQRPRGNWRLNCVLRVAGLFWWCPSVPQ